jgi:hypothetical protein
VPALELLDRAVRSADVHATRDTASLMRLFLIPLLIAVLALLAAMMMAVPPPDGWITVGPSNMVR